MSSEWAAALSKLSKITNLSNTDLRGRTALMWAANSGFSSDVAWFAGAYEPLFDVDSYGEDAATIATRRGDSLCAFDLVIEHRTKKSLVGAFQSLFGRVRRRAHLDCEEGGPPSTTGRRASEAR